MNFKKLAHCVRCLLPLLGALGIILSSVGTAEGQVKSSPRVLSLLTPVKPLFPWGSLTNVRNFAVTNSQSIFATVYGLDSFGNQNESMSGSALLADKSFGSYADISTAVQQTLHVAIAAAMTNTNVPINKDKNLLVGYSTVNFLYPPSNLSEFFGIVDYIPVKLTKTGSTYTIPDLSGITPQLLPQQFFYIPGLKWVRMEVYATNDLTTPVVISDSRDGSGSYTTVADIPNEGFFIGTDYIASGTHGPYQLKVSYFTSAGGFFIANGDGMQVQETPLVISNNKLSIHGQTVTMTVSGGDNGRVFNVQASNDLKTWSQVPGTSAYTVGTNTTTTITFNDSGITPPSHTLKGRYYRFVAANQPPL